MNFEVGQIVWLHESFGPWMKGRITGQVSDRDQWAVTTGPGMNYLRKGEQLRAVTSENAKCRPASCPTGRT